MLRYFKWNLAISKLVYKLYHWHPWFWMSRRRRNPQHEVFLEDRGCRRAEFIDSTTVLRVTVYIPHNGNWESEVGKINKNQETKDSFILLLTMKWERQNTLQNLLARKLQFGGFLPLEQFISLRIHIFSVSILSLEVWFLCIQDQWPKLLSFYNN